MGGRHLRSETVRRSGFTLLELLIAATLTLMMMGAVVTIFGVVSNTVNESRATMEMTERLRSTAMLLQEDLGGITATMMPPRDPDKGEGYFEYIEGPIGPVAPLNQAFGTSSSTATAYQPAINKEGLRASSSGAGYVVADCTVGDTDDILMFTTRRKGEPFQGRAYVTERTTNTRKNIIAKSDAAEVAWFMRGRTLYRRVLLVAPNIPILDTGSDITARCDYAYGFYAKSDISVHLASEDGNFVAPNSLGDLTKRENRFAHCMNHFSRDFFPFDVRRWCQMGLPTLLECSSMSWGVGTVSSHLFSAAMYGTGQAIRLDNAAYVEPRYAAQDYWSVNPYDRFTNPYNLLLGKTLVPSTSNNKYSGSRYAEDVVLNNVIGFDVKVWDPGAPIVAAGTTPPLNTVALVPGDPGYIAALTTLTLPGSGVTPENYPLAFGAYVDLNYMCRLGARQAYTTSDGVPHPVETYMPNYPFVSTSAGAPLPENWPAPWFHSAADIKYVASSATLKNYALREPDVYLRGHSPFAVTTPTTLPSRTYCDSWRAAVYDTWSTHYNRGGRFGFRPAATRTGTSTTPPGTEAVFFGRGMNGVDDWVAYSTYGGVTGKSSNSTIEGAGNGIVDDEDELEVCPPYSRPIRSLQVKIRAFEPSSRAVREVTIIQDFVPQ